MKVILFIDDLDRCPPEKAVEIFKSVALLTENTPFYVFLAIDPRIAVNSIEDMHNKFYSRANVSGYEYLQKIINLPFAIPELSESDKKNLCEGYLKGDDHNDDKDDVDDDDEDGGGGGGGNLKSSNVRVAGTSSFTLSGSAMFITSYIQLTASSKYWTSGSAFYMEKLTIDTFTCVFTISFQYTYADGVAFVIQDSSANAIGRNGEGLGYSGIDKSVAIIFKTFDNDNASAGVLSTGVYINGELSRLGSSGDITSKMGLQSGGTWNLEVTVIYDGKSLTWTLLNTENKAHNCTYRKDISISSYTKSSTAWVGFTGSTGAVTETCTITGFSFH